MDEFATRLSGSVKHIVVLKGGMGVKQRRAIAEQLTAIHSISFLFSKYVN